VHVLPVGRDDDHHHERDREPDLPGERVGGEAGHPEHEEDLVRGVGDRGECVTGEDREGDPLGEQGLAEAVAAHRAAQQQALERVRRVGHNR
jgi:hypothetical protein